MYQVHIYQRDIQLGTGIQNSKLISTIECVTWETTQMYALLYSNEQRFFVVLQYVPGAMDTAS